MAAWRRTTGKSVASAKITWVRSECALRQANPLVGRVPANSNLPSGIKLLDAFKMVAQK
jgi:hypothetical protein